MMKSFEISLEVNTVVRIKTKAFNSSDAVDTAYHLLGRELVRAADPAIQLSSAELGKILSVEEVKAKN